LVVGQTTYYPVNTTNWLKLPYEADDIDVLVAYIFPQDAWYVIPFPVVENRKALYVVPDDKKSRYKKYREAWKLMESASAKPAANESDLQGRACAVPVTLPKTLSKT